jgi:hypothetical protein
MMPKFALASAAILALGVQLAAFGVANPASAQLLTYTFDPFTHFTFEDLDSAILTGTFTLSEDDTFSAADIIIDGTGQEAGTYEPGEQGDNVLEYTDLTTSNEVFVRFNEILGAPHLLLTSVEWAGGSSRSNAIELGGGAHLPTVVPEPSTWAMMLLGFVGLGYAAIRRKAARGTLA